MPQDRSVPSLEVTSEFECSTQVDFGRAAPIDATPVPLRILAHSDMLRRSGEL
jgi:hypothetical protein